MRLAFEAALEQLGVDPALLAAAAPEQSMPVWSGPRDR